MNNDELKKKIADIIYHTGCTGACCECDYSKYSDADTYCKAMLKADALIEAGIGDVKEAETENAALRERLEKLYDKKVIANMLARLFSCPCNFTPLDEEMFDYCNDDCVMEDAVCWERVIDKEMRGKEAEARLAEMKGE